MADQVRLVARPAEDTIVKMFWAPDRWRWHRGVTSWNFAALVQRLAHAATLKEIYGIWQQMPLAAQLPSRGQKNKEKMHAELRDFKSAIKEASSFCRELGIKSLRHLDADSFRQVCREMGKFLAAQTFLTHCPAIVMDLPTAAIHDSKAHLRERAICDERISLPLSAFKDLDTIYPKLRSQFGSHNAMVEVKMNWRCTNEIWWCALVTDEALAARCYRKLGYADADDMVIRMREGRLAQGSQPVPPSAMSSQPQLTVENVVSVASDTYKKQRFSTKFAHAFWGKLECGLVLSSVSPWEYVPKEHGVRAAGGFACKYCDGFWKGSKGSSRVVQLMGRSAGKQLSLQLILDEPPEKLWQQWIKDRVEYYLRVEPVDAIRDEALDHSYPVEERIRFSIRNGLGAVSDLIWGILL